MELREGIYSRRSVRKFSEAEVSLEDLREIVRAGTWAPSGLNNQPWRFVIVRDPGMRERVAGLTKYGHIVRSASALIPVFIHRDSMYHETKDHQSMGACLQTMLLAAHALGLGAVWLGEILKNAEPVREVLGLPEGLELMAVLAIGYAAHDHHPSSTRKPLDEVILKEI